MGLVSGCEAKALPTTPVTTTPATTTPALVNLTVPFIPEVANGNWSKPWNNACEEASITAVEQFYLGTSPKNRAAEERMMLQLVAWENKQFGHNANTDAAETARVINDYSSFNASIKLEPTLEEIKAELTAGYPVISLHYGFGLNNPRLRFLATGSSYHMMVLVGFDDAKQEFIVNDNGWEGGLDSRYPYATILDTLHDYDAATKKTTGPATVLLTRPKQLVQAVDGKSIYLVENGQKRRIVSPAVFGTRRLSWDMVQKISTTELDAFPTGMPLTK